MTDTAAAAIGTRMRLRTTSARIVGFTLGLTALAAIILVSHLVPEHAAVLLPVGVVGLLAALGVGLRSATPRIDDAELLQRYAALLDERRDSRATAQSITTDEWRRLEALWEAAFIRMIRRRYRCGRADAAYVLERWKNNAGLVQSGLTRTGEAFLRDADRRRLDAWAAEVGLVPR